MFARAMPSLRAASKQAQPLASTSTAAAGRIAPRSLPFAARTYSADTKAEDKKADGAADASDAEKKIASLESRIKEVEKEKLYLQADVQTLNKRVIEERNKASEFAISSFAKSLLSNIDVLHTALSHVPKTELQSKSTLSDLYTGVEMTQKALLKTFEQSGIKKMEISQGDKFDPANHEATFQIPKEIAPKKASGEWGPGEIVQVAKEGWTIGNRVLRAAQVGVTQIE